MSKIKFRPRIKELQLLVERHYDTIEELRYAWIVYGTAGGSADICRELYAYRRIKYIESKLSKKAFSSSLSAVKEKWDKTYREIETIEASLSPCKTCGGKRVYREHLHISGEVCGRCKVRPASLNPQKVERLHVEF